MLGQKKIRENREPIHTIPEMTRNEEVKETVKLFNYNILPESILRRQHFLRK
jgi:hypothetical protein